MALIQCRECGNSISTEAAACPRCGAPRQSSSNLVEASQAIQDKPTSREETIHSDSSVMVTTTRVIIRGTTYALRNISSVRTGATPPSSGCAIILLLVGIFLLIGTLGLFAMITMTSGIRSSIGTGIVGIFFSGLVLVVAIVWYRSLKTAYHVVISSTSGEMNALTSIDKAYIDRIVNSINEAIVKYQ